MRCQWQSVRNILPSWIRPEVDKLDPGTVEELRFRVNQPPEVVCTYGIRWLRQKIVKSDLEFIINLASKYSPWSTNSLSRGYITIQGGHRLGICGTVLQSCGKVIGINPVLSICVRVAKDIDGISGPLVRLAGSVLIIGKPGSGKTTLLRDLIRSKSDQEKCHVGVVDEKAELFPEIHGEFCFPCGARVDVISGISKENGIGFLVRNMNPDIIAVDEITAEADSDALVRAAWCGVNLFATAHAASKEDLQMRPAYRPILENRIFDYLVVMQAGKKFTVERM